MGDWLCIVARTLGVANQIHRLSMSIIGLLVLNMAGLVCFMASLVSTVFVVIHCVSFGAMIEIADTSGVLPYITVDSVAYVHDASLKFHHTFSLNLFFRWRGAKCSAMNFRKVSLYPKSTN